ncbi:IS21-like element helper ATPase IstB [Ureibacillus thermosphaericus]|jgi:DNA replication protein DnaC|uniref:IS21-like element helper ATPase IstB n=1 Tax=Ureibacillus TaxID=160795 RepID=UPI0030C9EA88
MEKFIREYAKRLKLSWIPANYQTVQATTNEEFLLKLFEQEVQHRDERRTNLLLKQATLPKIPEKTYDWRDIQLAPGITRDYLLEGRFIDKQENLIFYGGVGTGKTFLSTLIALNIIKKQGKRVRFFTAASIVNALLEANEKGNIGKFLRQIEKLDLLILDELGYIPLHKQGAELLFQVISMCYEAKSIIVTTNLQFSQWNNVFGDPILTEAVIDRLIHHSHLIIFKGESHRYKDSISQY